MSNIEYKGVRWHAKDQLWVRQDIGFFDVDALISDGCADLTAEDREALLALRVAAETCARSAPITVGDTQGET